MHAVTTEPATFSGRSCKNICDGFATATRPGRSHFKNANFVRCAKTILYRTHDAVIVMTLAFEIKDRVDDMLESFGSGNRTFLGDVTDQEDGNGAVLRE